MKSVVETRALLVRSIPVRESDLVATFFTADAGMVPTMVRGGRASKRRFAGGLEPIHELLVRFEDRGGELCILQEARVVRPRLAVASDLDAMQAVGAAMRWLRHVCPLRTPEPSVWQLVTEWISRLDAAYEARKSPSEAKDAACASVAAFGLQLLSAVGYALELDSCVQCARVCPEGRSAYLDAARGGIVCSSCGGGRRKVSGAVRQAAMAAQRGEGSVADLGAAKLLLEVVEEAMSVHADFEAQRVSTRLPVERAGKRNEP